MKRALVAFDADEAGDRGAADLAQSLTACGCYRVGFPGGGTDPAANVLARRPNLSMVRPLTIVM